MNREMVTSSRRRTGRPTWRRPAAAVTACAAAILIISGGARAEPCVLSTGETTVTIGEPTAVCIVVNNLTWVVGDDSRKYSQVLITPEADEFSRFTVSGSWNSSTVSLDPILTTYGTDVGVHVESLGKYSFQKAFRIKDENITFPLHTAIIAVDKGEVTGISWDDGCHFCTSNDCQENTYDYSGELAEDSGEDCYWPDAECYEVGTEGSVSSLCQLTVYVVWSGTDSKGNYFTSSSKRLSMFAGNTIDGLIEDAADTYQKTIEPADQ